MEFEKKKVFNTLSLEKINKISSFFWRRSFFNSSFMLPDGRKVVSFVLRGDHCESQNKFFKSLRSSFRHFLSREKAANNGEFKVDLNLLNLDDTQFYILENVSSCEFLTREHNERLKLLSFYMLDEKYVYFLIIFKDGNFTDDYSSKKINGEKTFTSEKCVICLENMPIVIFSDCGHTCMCEECSEANNLIPCPVCRTRNRSSYYYLHK